MRRKSAEFLVTARQACKSGTILFMHNDNTTRRFDLIAFDWDGTLFDSTASIVRCLQEAVQDVGGTRPTHEQASYVIGLSLPLALRHVAGDISADKYPLLTERFRYHYVRHMNDITLFDGAVELLHKLRDQGYKLAVATGKNRRGLDEVLQTVNLTQVFHATRTADQTASKPDPLMLHELMEELDVTPQRTLMVGDTTHDLQMALNAGCPSVAVSFGAHKPTVFSNFKPLFVADNIAALSDWIFQPTPTPSNASVAFS